MATRPVNIETLSNENFATYFPLDFSSIYLRPHTKMFNKMEISSLFISITIGRPAGNYVTPSFQMFALILNTSFPLSTVFMTVLFALRLIQLQICNKCKYFINYSLHSFQSHINLFYYLLVLIKITITYTTYTYTLIYIYLSHLSYLYL